MAEKHLTTKPGFNLTQDQVGKINWRLADVGALLGCLSIAVMGSRELGPDFDLEHYVMMVDDRFDELVSEFNEATGQTIDAQQKLVQKLRQEMP